MPREGVMKVKHKDILTYEEILRLIRVAVSLGVDKIRLTGGEPLLRNGIYEFLPRITCLPGLKDVGITTNGIYLKENLEKIKSAGIRRINISLDTLRRDRYEKVTGYDGFQDVWEGLELVSKLDFDPIKINVVVIKGMNDDEVLDLARLSLQYPYHIRFIEYMPFGITNQEFQVSYVPNNIIKKQLSCLGKLIKVPGTANDGPAERFKFKGAPGEIGFISPLSHSFCSTCNRLRLTADGHLRPCLLSDQEEDLKGPMRNGASDNDLERIFLETAFNKPYAHHLTSENSTHLSTQMSSIGG